MKKIIIPIILICLLLLPLNAFAITYGKVGENTNFNGDVNIPSGSNYYKDEVALDLVQCRNNATEAPAVTDDTTEGYEVNSVWTDITNDKSYVCVDATEDNAVWIEITITQLSDLSDVNTSTVTDKFVLVADGVDFESRALVEADISDLGTYADSGANTDITSIYNTSLKFGRDADNLIDFATTDNKIIFRTNGTNNIEILSTGELDLNAFSVGMTTQTLTGDGTDEIDWTDGNYMMFTCTTSDETFTFVAPSNPCGLTLQIKQDATAGGRDITFPAAVKWLGTEPTWADGGISKTIIMSMRYDGTNYWSQGTSWEQ